MKRDTLGRGGRLAATVSLTSCLLLVGFAGTALASDYDGDGSSTPADCNDLDAAIHPGAVDKPDFAFEDTNCDGIDGDINQAIFVDGGGGLDTRSGTRDFPKKTISNAILAAKLAGKDVYVAAGAYPESLTLDTGVSIYGGYTPNFSARTTTEPTTVTGAPQAALADGKNNITLQMLTLVGGPAGPAGSSYGLRVVNSGKVALDHVTAQGGAAGAGGAGGTGGTGAKGADGTIGNNGSCAGGGSGPSGGSGTNNGGRGGDGGFSSGGGGTGGNGAPSGSVGTGSGGGGGDSGVRNTQGGGGTGGNNGSTGGVGGSAPLPTLSLDLPNASGWIGAAGFTGTTGATGTGGGGGGGGGGANSNFGAINYNAGGGSGGSGGAGGAGGGGGTPGAAGGGSFGVFIFNGSVVSRDSVVKGGNGGSGGDGGRGGDPGGGGTGGGVGIGGSGGATTGCGDGAALNAHGGNGGKGGDGGKGGAGGPGSGGTGGPSAGVYRGGVGSSYSMRTTTQTGGTGGTGGRLGGNGAFSATGQSGGLLQSATVGTTAGDFDGDGITDPLDDCPTVAAVASVNGCPARAAKLVDTDHDGIPDADGAGNPIDKCPTVAPAPGTDANGDGCPDPVITPTPTETVTPIQQPSGGNTPPPSGGGGGTTPAAAEQVIITLSYFAKSSARTSKFTTLKVRNVPLGATVKVTCKGSGCPSGLKGKGFTKKNAFGAVDLKKFIKKPLKVGVTITVVVSKPNAISAVKVLKVRKAKAPSITTRCIRPGSTKQVACA